MSGYSAYLTGEDGHITNRVTILAASDEEAKERAKQLVDGHVVELWQEGRKIATRSMLPHCKIRNASRRPQANDFCVCAFGIGRRSTRELRTCLAAETYMRGSVIGRS